jgi:hypothetical protein
MISSTKANYTINIGIHVLILFSFLSLFFFLYISHLEKTKVNDELNNLLSHEISGVLDHVDSSLHPSKLEWEKINTFAVETQKNSQGDLPFITRNNRNLLYYGIGIIASICILLIGLYIYYTKILHININLKHIIMENCITFIFIGVIEILFFNFIASKYIPVPPVTSSNTVLERIKNNINDYLLSPIS